MKKTEIVQKIRSARLAHVQWVQRAKSLVKGLPIKEEDIPLTSDACSFGKWFYSDGQILLAIFNEKHVRELEVLHTNLHEEYMSIFKIYFDLSDIGFFAKLFKRGRKVSEIEKKEALLHLASLEKVSNELIGTLNSMETRINMADASLFEKYV